MQLQKMATHRILFPPPSLQPIDAKCILGFFTVYQGSTCLHWIKWAANQLMFLYSVLVPSCPLWMAGLQDDNEQPVPCNTN